MSGKSTLKHKLPEILKHLWEQNFFQDERTLDDIKNKLSDLGSNPSNQSLHMALTRARGFLTKRGAKRKYKYIQKHASKAIILSNDIMPVQLIKDLGKDFESEMVDLRLNFGRSGSCTAFLLRKILEKIIFLAFTKNGFEDRLKENGDFVGLNKMLSLATTLKVKGQNFLMPQTARKIEAIKFLGDASAHNPLVNISMDTILPVMPFIIIAYQELAKKL